VFIFIDSKSFFKFATCDFAQNNPFNSVYQVFHLPQPAATTTAAAGVSPEAVIFNGFSRSGHHTIHPSASGSGFDTGILCCHVGKRNSSHCHCSIQYSEQQPATHGHIETE
jgi:hypothetical protein